jgi:iron-sulfur cluster insertion protein
VRISEYAKHPLLVGDALEQHAGAINIKGVKGMITLSPNAAKVVQMIMDREKLAATTSLRIGVTTEGCEGSGTQFRYVLGFDPHPTEEDDHLFESEGMKLVVDDASLPHLDGLQLDVRQSLGGVEFLFRNPNASHSCGCGHTFSEDEAEDEELEE